MEWNGMIDNSLNGYRSRFNPCKVQYSTVLYRIVIMCRSVGMYVCVCAGVKERRKKCSWQAWILILLSLFFIKKNPLINNN
jgi:hypothetical protein